MLRKLSLAVWLMLASCSPRGAESDNAAAVAGSDESLDFGAPSDATPSSALSTEIADPLLRLALSPTFAFDPEIDKSTCTEHDYGGTRFYNCDATPLQPCPFSSVNECQVEVEFAGDRLSTLSFKYDPEDFDHEAFIRAATTEFGAPKRDTKDARPAGIDQTMSTWAWKKGKLRVQIFDTSGVNFEGNPYHDVSVDFRNAAIPDAMSVISSAAAQ